MKHLKKLVTLALVLGLLSQIPAAAQKATSFAIKDGHFYAGNDTIQIYSGEMHYSRIPKEYWRQRMQMIKAMGLNTIATYVFWNYHNTAPGKWDFETGNKDLAEYIRTAQEEGLYVILRPGPYICAEWEFGGYPWWLQNNPDLVIRTDNQAFLDSCKQYINHLAAEVGDLQLSKGGNIIMVQVENEFGSYVSQRKDIPADVHLAYRTKIYNMLKEAGFEGPFFTSDGTWLFDGGAVEGALPTANGEGNVANLRKAVNQFHNNEGPYMVAEFYPGWLDHWGEDFVTIGSDAIAKQTETYLKNHVSFNLYMAHGGTNFGFTSGANYNDQHDIQPDITSYDYDAPISEAGWATPKYMAIRELMKQYATYDIPEIPERFPVIELPKVEWDQPADVLTMIKSEKPVTSDVPLTFEQLGQGYGYVLYSFHFTQPIKGTLKVPGLRDYATVYVNGKKKGELNRMLNAYEMEIDIPFNGTLELLVENMGRINYGSEIVNNKKGIISPITINDYEISGNWEMYKAPFVTAPKMIETSAKKGAPALYRGTFKLKKAGDIFLNMSEWGKGIVFVNGHNLGRYWQVGPQQTLYLPGCWLKKGENEILIFEQLNDLAKPVLSSSPEPILNKLTIETE